MSYDTLVSLQPYLYSFLVIAIAVLAYRLGRYGR